MNKKFIKGSVALALLAMLGACHDTADPLHLIQDAPKAAASVPAPTTTADQAAAFAAMEERREERRERRRERDDDGGTTCWSC